MSCETCNDVTTTCPVCGDPWPGEIDNDPHIEICDADYPDPCPACQPDRTET